MVMPMLAADSRPGDLFSMPGTNSPSGWLRRLARVSTERGLIDYGLPAKRATFQLVLLVPRHASLNGACAGRSCPGSGGDAGRVSGGAAS